jgi:hypothetical protein
VLEQIVEQGRMLEMPFSQACSALPSVLIWMRVLATPPRPTFWKIAALSRLPLAESSAPTPGNAPIINARRAVHLCAADAVAPKPI